MQTDRPAVPRLLVRNPPLRVKLALDALEAAGFRITGDIEELDSGRIVIGCRLPAELADVMRGDHTDYEKIINYQVECAQRALKGFADVEVKAFAWSLTIWLPPVSPTPNFHPLPGRRLGRTPAKEAAVEAKKLHDQGVPFGEIEKRLGNKFGHREPQSWQRLLHRYFPPQRLDRYAERDSATNRDVDRRSVCDADRKVRRRWRRRFSAAAAAAG
jgi:hypothetical protein